MLKNEKKLSKNELEKVIGGLQDLGFKDMKTNVYKGRFVPCFRPYPEKGELPISEISNTAIKVIK